MISRQYCFVPAKVEIEEHHIVLYEYPKTRNLRLLYRSKIKCFHCTFGFSYKENMLNSSLIKSDCPVRWVISYWSRNLKGSWKFCIYTYFFCCIQIFSKSSLNTLFCRTIRKYIILNGFLCKESIRWRRRLIDELDDAEADFVSYRLKDLAVNPMPGEYNTDTFWKCIKHGYKKV